MEITKPTTHSLGTTSPQPLYKPQPLMGPLTKDPTITILSYIEDAPWRLSQVSKQWQAFAEEIYIRLWITYKAKPELQKYILKIELEYSTCSRRVLTLYQNIMDPINGPTPFSHNHALSCLDASQLIKFSQAPTLCQFFDAWNVRNRPTITLNNLPKNPTIIQKATAIATWLQNDANNGLRIDGVEGIRLHFDSSKLTALPDLAGSLTKLRTLYLDHNQLTELPDSTRNWTRLKVFWLNHNELTRLPDSIGNLTSLQRLYLHYNQLTELPDSVTNLTNLSLLQLQNNQLTKLPSSIGNLTRLQELHLNHNRLTRLPDSIGNLTSLLVLDLSDNQLTKSSDSFRRLTRLISLDLSNNQLIEIPDSIGHLTRGLTLNPQQAVYSVLEPIERASEFDWEFDQSPSTFFFL